MPLSADGWFDSMHEAPLSLHRRRADSRPYSDSTPEMILASVVGATVYSWLPSGLHRPQPLPSRITLRPEAMRRIFGVIEASVAESTDWHTYSQMPRLRLTRLFRPGTEKEHHDVLPLLDPSFMVRWEYASADRPQAKVRRHRGGDEIGSNVGPGRGLAPGPDVDASMGAVMLVPDVTPRGPVRRSHAAAGGLPPRDPIPDIEYLTGRPAEMPTWRAFCPVRPDPSPASDPGGYLGEVFHAVGLGWLAEPQNARTRLARWSEEQAVATLAPIVADDQQVIASWRVPWQVPRFRVPTAAAQTEALSIGLGPHLDTLTWWSWQSPTEIPRFRFTLPRDPDPVPPLPLVDEATRATWVTACEQPRRGQAPRQSGGTARVALVEPIETTERAWDVPWQVPGPRALGPPRPDPPAEVQGIQNWTLNPDIVTTWDTGQPGLYGQAWRPFRPAADTVRDAQILLDEAGQIAWHTMWPTPFVRPRPVLPGRIDSVVSPDWQEATTNYVAGTGPDAGPGAGPGQAAGSVVIVAGPYRVVAGDVYWAGAIQGDIIDQ